jgi:anti-sigma B factor antagonist
MGLEVATHRRGGLAVAMLSGELDIYTVPVFRREVHESGCTGVVLDMHQVRLVDSSGLGAIISLRSRLPADGPGVAIAGATPPVLRVFDITGTRQSFAFGDDVASVVEGMQSTAATGGD